MSIDERLLQNPGGKDGDKQGSDEKAGYYREKKREGMNDDDQVESPRQPSSLNQAVRDAKKVKAAKDKKASGKLGKIIYPFRIATSALLRQAWLHWITTWSLTGFYILTHGGLKTIFGEKFFCKYGDEWSDQNSSLMLRALNEKKKPNKMVQTIEIMGVTCISGCCILEVILPLSIISLIIGVIENPFGNIELLLGLLWEVLKSVF